MTRTEKKLRKAGFEANITDGSIKINNTNEVEVYVIDSDGDQDWDATEDLKSKVAEALGWGGFKSGWGGWILQKDYAGNFATMLDQLGPAAYS